MKHEIPLFLGTYTESLPHVGGRGPGVVLCRFDVASGAISVTGDPVPVRNPAYLWRNGGNLYATSEITDFNGLDDGCLSLLHLADKQLLSKQVVSSGGSGPAWLRGDISGRWLMVVNYVEGNVRVFALGADGSVGENVCHHRFSGNGPNPVRQESSHPHAILCSPDNRHVYLADLGTDEILIFDFDQANGFLNARTQHPTPPGSGPRHLLFDSEGRYLFVVCELSSELAVYERNPADGLLSPVSRVCSVPPGTADNHPSEFALTNDGRHLYLANRGHDSIAHFRIDPANGKAERLSTTPCGGHIPRHLALSPDDQFLLVANQESDQVVSFRRDPEGGCLQSTGSALEIGTPCFVLF